MSHANIIQFKAKQQPEAATTWTLDTPLDYIGIAYYLKSELHLLDNNSWMRDRRKEWAQLPAEFQAELEETLDFVQRERAEWFPVLMDSYANRAEHHGAHITVRNVCEPQSRKWGWRATKDYYQAVIIKNKSITISGDYGNHVDGPQEFRKTFNVGDDAVSGSYNLIYTGKIVFVGEHFVRVLEKGYSKAKQLTLAQFIYYNWNYDAKKISAHNSEEMYHI